MPISLLVVAAGCGPYSGISQSVKVYGALRASSIPGGKALADVFVVAAFDYRGIQPVCLACRWVVPFLYDPRNRFPYEQERA